MAATASTRARFLTSQGLGQLADGLTAMVLAHLLLGGGNGVEPDRLLETLAAAAIPYAVIGPVSGALADRWPRRSALGAVHACRGFLTIGAVVAVDTGHRPIGLAIAAGLLCCARFVYQLRAASLPRIAANGKLVDLDARSLTVGMVVGTSGAVLGATTGTVAPGALLTAAAVAQALAGCGFATLDTPLGGGRDELVSRDAGPSLTEVARHLVGLVLGPATRSAIWATSANRCLLGAVFATSVLVAANRLDLGPNGYVAALVVTGAGSLAGTFTAPVFAARLGLRGITRVAFATPALALGVAVASGAVVALAMAATASFFAFQNLRVTADAVVQTAVHDRVRARVFSIYDAAYNLTYFLGAALVLATGLGDRPVVALASVAALAGVFVSYDLAVRLPRLITPITLRSPP